MKALLAAGVMLFGLCSPALAQRQWPSSLPAFINLLETGHVADAGMKRLVDHSGWSVIELRQGLQRPYKVDQANAQRFLDSEAGRLWLANQSWNIQPFTTTPSVAAASLRNAILIDAADGEITGAGILAGLPQAQELLVYSDANPLPANVCAVARCMDPEQCGSTLSWLMFLPACLQANSGF